MNITKYGQCCLLVEMNGKRILTDPGRFGSGFTELKDIDLILITHEHADHLHTDSLRSVLSHNPSATVVCNNSVGKILESEEIAHLVLEGRSTREVAGVTLQAYDGKHVEIFEDFGQVQNTGYFVGGELFYPGDAYTVPEQVPRVLALPVAGPWCQLPDALRYAMLVKPQAVFPVHDWLLNEDGVALTYMLTEKFLKENSIFFGALRNGETIEI